MASHALLCSAVSYYTYATCSTVAVVCIVCPDYRKLDSYRLRSFTKQYMYGISMMVCIARPQKSALARSADSTASTLDVAGIDRAQWLELGGPFLTL